MGQVLEYITKKGWQAELVDSGVKKEWRLLKCPVCGDVDDKGLGHFFINNSTGFWYCHKCGESGGIYSLKKIVGDTTKVSQVAQEDPVPPPNIEQAHMIKEVLEAHIRLREHKPVQQWIRNRRWSSQAVEHFKLGVSKDSQGVQWLWYPSFEKGILTNIKYRTLPPAKKGFKRMVGGESGLFNSDALDDEDKSYIILTEGESDCISVWSAGLDKVVGVTIGAQGVNNSWVTRLDKFEKIYFAYDTDSAGKSGAAKFAKRLGLERCYEIKIPGPYKDCNEYLQAGAGFNEFQHLLETAKQFDVEDVKSIETIIEERIEHMGQTGDTTDVIPFPWPDLNKITGGLVPGDLFIVGGRPGVGKTTFALQLLYEFAKVGIPSLLFELEMRPERLMPRFIAMHLRKNSTMVENIEDLTKAKTEMKGLPLYIAYQYRRPNWERIEDTLHMCFRRYGIRFMVFDNLHFLVRDEENIAQKVGEITRGFKLLAEEVAIPIMAIARPKKLAGKIIDSEDLKWSSDIEGDADAVILLHREKVNKPSKGKEQAMIITGEEGIFEPKTLVIVDKMRFNKGGNINLRSIDDQARFEPWEMKGMV